MTYWSEIGLAPQEQLLDARRHLHKAMQWLTMAARANIEQWPDDGQSNLGWSHDLNIFTSHPFSEKDGKDLMVGLSATTLELSILRGGTIKERFALNGKTNEEAGAWLDDQLKSAGYDIASTVQLPYELYEDLLAIKTYDTSGIEQGLLEYEKWFAASDEILNEIKPDFENFKPGPSPVRTWPHHIDIATYIQLEEGEFETAKGIGVGMAAGDKNCQDPYFYVYPWPRPNPDILQEIKVPGCYWSKSGYIGGILSRDVLLKSDDRKATAETFLREVIQQSQDILEL